MIFWTALRTAASMQDPAGMNTFVERPAIEARLLYWLTALHAVNGMLYCTLSFRSVTLC